MYTVIIGFYIIDDIEEMGFKRPTDTDVEYKLVTLRWEVREATLTQVDGDGEMYKSGISPDVWGSIDTDENHIIGGNDYGFDDCMYDAIRNVVKSDTFFDGDTISFTVEGKILLPIFADSESYLVIYNAAEEDYDKAKLYFMLE